MIEQQQEQQQENEDQTTRIAIVADENKDPSTSSTTTTSKSDIVNDENALHPEALVNQDEGGTGNKVVSFEVQPQQGQEPQPQQPQAQQSLTSTASLSFPPAFNSLTTIHHNDSASHHHRVDSGGASLPSFSHTTIGNHPRSRTESSFDYSASSNSAMSMTGGGMDDQYSTTAASITALAGSTTLDYLHGSSTSTIIAEDDQVASSQQPQPQPQAQEPPQNLSTSLTSTGAGPLSGEGILANMTTPTNQQQQQPLPPPPMPPVIPRQGSARNLLGGGSSNTNLLAPRPLSTTPSNSSLTTPNKLSSHHRSFSGGSNTSSHHNNRNSLSGNGIPQQIVYNGGGANLPTPPSSTTSGGKGHSFNKYYNRPPSYSVDAGTAMHMQQQQQRHEKKSSSNLVVQTNGSNLSSDSSALFQYSPSPANRNNNKNNRGGLLPSSTTSSKMSHGNNHAGTTPHANHNKNPKMKSNQHQIHSLQSYNDDDDDDEDGMPTPPLDVYAVPVRKRSISCHSAAAAPGRGLQGLLEDLAKIDQEEEEKNRRKEAKLKAKAADKIRKSKSKLSKTKKQNGSSKTKIVVEPEDDDVRLEDYLVQKVPSSDRLSLEDNDNADDEPPLPIYSPPQLSNGCTSTNIPPGGHYHIMVNTADPRTTNLQDVLLGDDSDHSDISDLLMDEDDAANDDLLDHGSSSNHLHHSSATAASLGGGGAVVSSTSATAADSNAVVIGDVVIKPLKKTALLSSSQQPSSHSLHSSNSHKQHRHSNSADHQHHHPPTHPPSGRNTPDRPGSSLSVGGGGIGYSHGPGVPLPSGGSSTFSLPPSITISGPPLTTLTRDRTSSFASAVSTQSFEQFEQELDEHQAFTEEVAKDDDSDDDVYEEDQQRGAGAGGDSSSTSSSSDVANSNDDDSDFADPANVAAKNALKQHHHHKKKHQQQQRPPAASTAARGRTLSGSGFGVPMDAMTPPRAPPRVIPLPSASTSSSSSAVPPKASTIQNRNLSNRARMLKPKLVKGSGSNTKNQQKQQIGVTSNTTGAASSSKKTAEDGSSKNNKNKLSKLESSDSLDGINVTSGSGPPSIASSTQNLDDTSQVPSEDIPLVVDDFDFDKYAPDGPGVIAMPQQSQQQQQHQLQSSPAGQQSGAGGGMDQASPGEGGGGGSGGGGPAYGVDGHHPSIDMEYSPTHTHLSNPHQHPYQGGGNPYNQPPPPSSNNYYPASGSHYHNPYAGPLAPYPPAPYYGADPYYHHPYGGPPPVVPPHTHTLTHAHAHPPPHGYPHQPPLPYGGGYGPTTGADGGGYSNNTNSNPYFSPYGGGPPSSNNNNYWDPQQQPYHHPYYPGGGIPYAPTFASNITSASNTSAVVAGNGGGIATGNNTKEPKLLMKQGGGQQQQQDNNKHNTNNKDSEMEPLVPSTVNVAFPSSPHPPTTIGGATAPTATISTCSHNNHQHYGSTNQQQVFPPQVYPGSGGIRSPYNHYHDPANHSGLPPPLHPSTSRGSGTGGANNMLPMYHKNSSGAGGGLHDSDHNNKHGGGGNGSFLRKSSTSQASHRASLVEFAKHPKQVFDEQVDSVFSSVRSLSAHDEELVNEDALKYLDSNAVQRAFPERFMALLITLLVELPTLFMISGGSQQLCGLLGRSKYQLLMAFLPLTSAISGNCGLQGSTLTTRAVSHNQVSKYNFAKWLREEVVASLLLGMGMAMTLGGLAYVASNYDLVFATTIAMAQILSIVTAGVTGTLAPLLFTFIFSRDSGKWGGPLETAIQDIVGSFAMVVLSYHLLKFMGPMEISPNDMCGGTEGGDF